MTNFVDFTLPRACKWYSDIIDTLLIEHGLETMHLQTPALSVPTKTHNSPILYMKNYITSVASVANISSFMAHQVQELPMMVYLVQHYTIDPAKFMHSIIPNALSVSLAGYSFLSPALIGFKLASSHEEVYIRTTQISALMPAMVFVYPSDLGYSQKVVDLMKKYIDLHREHSKLIVDLAKKRIADGSPIIRPMWYAEPEDPRAFTIDDQFMLGDDILVAPVVTLGQHERMVYLPSGKWVDQHGQQFQGSGEVKVQAPLEELPHFKRIKE